jgi:hypothetical protein
LKNIGGFVTKRQESYVCSFVNATLVFPGFIMVTVIIFSITKIEKAVFNSYEGVMDAPILRAFCVMQQFDIYDTIIYN